jgi:hypothetical protein
MSTYAYTRSDGTRVTRCLITPTDAEWSQLDPYTRASRYAAVLADDGRVVSGLTRPEYDHLCRIAHLSGQPIHEGR